MNSAAKGRAAEHRSKRILEAGGYEVIRAAGSHGTWDLIAVSETDILLVQVKTRDWPGPEEREAIELAKCPQNGRKLVHRWRAGQHMPDVIEVRRAA